MEKHSLPPPGSPPFPGGGAWRDGHTALAVLLTSVAAAGLSTGPSRRSREGNSTTAGHTQSKGVLQWQWKSIAINSWANFSDQWVRKRTLGKEKEAPWIAWGRGSPGCCFWGERKGWERIGGWEGREQWKDAEYPKEMPKCSCAKCGPREATRTLFSASREGRVSEGCCNLRATRANSTVVLDTWFQKKSLILLEKLAKLAWSL